MPKICVNSLFESNPIFDRYPSFIYIFVRVKLTEVALIKYPTSFTGTCVLLPFRLCIFFCVRKR